MEDIASDLKISELKQTSLCKSFEQLHSQASNVLVFSLQWKELESHFDSTRKSLQTGLQNLSEREKEVIVREKDLQARESRFHSDLAAKEEELERIASLIEGRSKEADLNNQHLDSLKSLIQENGEELEIKEKHYEAIQRSIVDKDKELDHIQICVQEEETKLENTKSSVKNVKGKLLALERRIAKKTEESESKEKEVNELRKNLKVLKDEVELYNSKLEAIRLEAELKEKEIKQKEEKLNAINNSVTECSNELKSKEKLLEFVRMGIEIKNKNFVSLKNSVDQCAQEFERKEREIEGLMKELESKEKSIESKIEEVNLIHSKVNDCLKEVESRENNVDSLKKCVDESLYGLQVRETQFMKRVSEFETRQREFNTSQKSIEVRTDKNTVLPHSQVKSEPLENAQFDGAMVPFTEGKTLQVLLSRHLKTHDMVCKEVSNILRASVDPPRLVLDAMEGFYPSESSGESSEFELKIVRRSCILLLEQLVGASAQISPQVKEEAMKIASDWMVKITATRDYLEGLGIVQLLTSYGLVSSLNGNELHILLDVVGLQGLSHGFRQALLNGDKALVVPKHEHAAENSLDDIMTSHSIGPASVMYKISQFLEKSPDPARHVLDYIERSFSHNWKAGNLAFEARYMDCCIFLFEQLLRISPEIQQFVRDKAMEVAVKWKENLQVDDEKPHDVFGFLQFLHTYGIFYLFDSDEILKLLEVISRREYALGVCRALRFSDAIPEFIQSLIERRKIIDAVRLICAFKLNNSSRFSPVSLLLTHMKDLKESTFKNCKGKRPIEEKDKAADEEIAALKAVISCVVENNPALSEISLHLISRRINSLKHSKMQRRFPQNKAEQVQKQHKKEDKTWEKRGREVSPQQGGPFQGRNKFPRTSPSGHRLHCPPAFVPIVRESEFDREDHSTHFSLGGSSNMFGSNFDPAGRY